MLVIKPAKTAYGNCVFTWSIWSLADAIEEITEVSEIGEQWSPKSPPPRAAAIAIELFIPISWEIGTAIASIIANVPHDVPVENDIKQLVKNNKTGTNLGERISFNSFET